MIVSLIAAMSENRAIGKEGRMPWKRVPADMQHLKDLARGRMIAMGSETARSMIAYKSPLLAECRVIVLTRGTGDEFRDLGFTVAHSLEDALALAEAAGENELCILGGGQIYAEALQTDVVHRIYLTLIHTVAEGDTFFPEISGEAWKEIAREDHDSDEKNPYVYSFVTYERIPALSASLS